MINVELTVQAAKSSVSMTLGAASQVPLTERRPGGKLEEEVEKDKEEEEKEEEEEEKENEGEEEEKEEQEVLEG